MGISWNDFWQMNPRIIKAITKGHFEKIREQDSIVHAWFGTYGISALVFAIDHCIHPKDAKSEYIKESIYSNVGLSEDEINERELRKMIAAEEAWIINDRQRNLAETIIK